MIFGSLGATGRVLALAGTVVSAAVALVTLSAAPAQPSPAIEWDGRLLSVTAEQVPLHDVLQGVARRTGVAFGGTEPLQDDVSFHFSGLPLGEALKRLAAGFNHVVVEERAPGGEIRPVRVLFLSGVDSRDEGQDELAAMAESKTGPSQTEAERAE